MKTGIKLTLALLSANLFLLSCTKDKAEEIVVATPSECETEVSYSTDVQPIVNLNCSFAGCHDTGSASGGYSFTTHGDISSNITAFQGVINHESGFSPMPKFASKLDDSTLQVIDCWVTQGMLNN